MRHTFKLGICRFPGDGKEAYQLTTWLMKTFHEMKQDLTIEKILMTEGELVVCDTPVTMSRNRAVKACLKAEVDYILMVDNDMAPDYLVGIDPLARPFWEVAWGFMMARREDESAYWTSLGDSVAGGIESIAPSELEAGVREVYPPAAIAAPYCGPPPEENCYVFRWKTFESENPNPNWKLEMIDREDAARRSGVEEVAALPTGLILYDARLFKILAPPWFDYEYEDEEKTRKATTEDVYLTRNASLHSPSLPMFVAWDSWAVHIKTKLVKRPWTITKDMVHKDLARAVLKGHDSNSRLRMVHPHDVVSKLPVASCQLPESS